MGFFSIIGSGDDSREVVAALDRSQASIQFTPDGKILTANKAFLGAVGYELAEIVGKHHSIFVEKAYAQSKEYRDFWRRLEAGEFFSDEIRRYGKDGCEIWLQATYNPVFGRDGKVRKVIKFATDITERKRNDADLAGQIAAIRRSQAVIEFDLDGKILWANQNFLTAMGYTLKEIEGRHHSMFVEPADVASPQYRQFWESLRGGKAFSAESKRIARNGSPVWIQASYNPILDAAGRPFKVVKYATVTTEAVVRRQNAEAVQAVVSENLSQVDTAIAEANSQATTVASASEQTTANVQAVAAGAEELNASVREIAESMTKSKAEADGAFRNAEDVDAAMKRLRKAAEDMSGVVSLIRNIAGQINLLALNATIESARAGEAGKGFAVVATEVKNLARQSGEATERIAREIEGMQGVSTEVAGGVDRIRKSIESVREFVASTAAAVEEQSAVAREMSQNMQTAADAVGSISESVVRIAQSTKVAEASTKSVREAVSRF